MNSYVISEHINAQVVIWAAASAIYTAAHWMRNVVELVAIILHQMTWEVSWETKDTIAALKAVACVAFLAAGLTVAIAAPMVIVGVFVVWVALMVVKYW